MVNRASKAAKKLEPGKEPKRVCSICGRKYRIEPAFKVHMQMKHGH